MKKQVLIAAVAASMTSVAMADISITGNAKFEYFNSQTGSAAATNKTNTEANLSIKGKNGDTTVVMNLEANTHGNASTTGALDIEDMYVTTKIGDVSIKAGNYATGTSAILGEIDNGGRATNKVTLSTKVGGATIYAGNSGAAAGVGQTNLNANMFAGIKMDVAGFTVQAKKNNENVDSFGIAGSVSGVDVRLEQKNDTVANGDTVFGQVSTSMNGIDLAYAWIDSDKANQISENDSAIFAVENGGLSATTDTGNKQISASTSVAGNKVTVKSGSIENGIATGTDLDYMQVSATRALASGATATVTYTDKDATATTDTETLEIDLSVKF